MYHVGKIVRKQLASPTVMVLELKVPSLSSFLPGQWVDFVVPPHSWIGGFSIASSPKDLPNLTLAIKRSNHPPATWVHEESQVDQEVHVQVGGTSVLLSPLVSTEEESSALDDFLLSPPRIFCAGGIGISPVLSQYREFLSQRASCATPSTPGPPARFLYTVSEQSELVFADELAELSTLGKSSNPGDRMVFALTQTSKWNYASTEYLQRVELKTGRVMKSFLDEAPKESIFYLCGPPGMLDDAVSHLTVVRGVDPANIQYEKWW
jgi:ferredoxin-NADP reductase